MTFVIPKRGRSKRSILRPMSARVRCYDCFRPQDVCVCKWIPSIDNQTEVLILQHRREHFHRFNTARIVHKALRNSQLLADHTYNLAKRLRLKPRAGLLYPGPTSILISDLPVDQRPQQLVVVDGTWHHTKTLIRDIPALQRLPRYQLAPAAPSRYRIRREPDDMALSTVEAAVAALRILEPETRGFEQLLNAFEQMVEVQLAHPGSAGGSRFQTRPSRTVKNIPLALHGNLADIVVAYGEAPEGERGRKRTSEPPLAWVAQRLGDGAFFACTLIPHRPLSDVFLGHLELTQADFRTALSLGEARQQWSLFQRPNDIVVVQQPGTARMFSYLAGDRAECLVLKSVDIGTIPATRTLETSASSVDNSFPGARPLGRASKRLAANIAFVRYLNALVGSHSQYPAPT